MQLRNWVLPAMVLLLAAGCSGKRVRMYQNEAWRMYCEKVGPCEKRYEPAQLSSFEQYASEREAVMKRDGALRDERGIPRWKEDEWFTPRAKAGELPAMGFPVTEP
jgi:hypothetical protein